MATIKEQRSVGADHCEAGEDTITGIGEYRKDLKSSPDHSFMVQDVRAMSKTHITKDEFVALLRAAGITEGQMAELHRLFEQRHPSQHQTFLELLGISPDSIVKLRQASVR